MDRLFILGMFSFKKSKDKLVERAREINKDGNYEGRPTMLGMHAVYGEFNAEMWILMIVMLAYNLDLASGMGSTFALLGIVFIEICLAPIAYYLLWVVLGKEFKERVYK